MHDEYYQKYKKTIVIDIDDTISTQYHLQILLMM